MRRDKGMNGLSLKASLVRSFLHGSGLFFLILDDSFTDTLDYRPMHLRTNSDTFVILFIQSSSFSTCDNLTRSGSPILEAASHYEKRRKTK